MPLSAIVAFQPVLLQICCHVQLESLYCSNVLTVVWKLKSTSFFFTQPETESVSVSVWSSD